MKFLVRIDVELPSTMHAEMRSKLLAAELERGRQLKTQGSIHEIWRIPGGLRNVAVWEVVDATELHELIASLPLFPYLRAEVTPLALHPVDRA
jgi:muconolactone D-isomerase